MSKAAKTSPPSQFRVTVGVPLDRERVAEAGAELALMRAGEFAIYKPARNSEPLFDMAVMSGVVARFLIQLRSYSAFKAKIEPESIPVLELAVGVEDINAARRSSLPVVMFLFDSDRGHGRYLRLDTFPKPADDAKTVVLSFPVENTITGDSLRVLIKQMTSERPVPVAS